MTGKYNFVGFQAIGIRILKLCDQAASILRGIATGATLVLRRAQDEGGVASALQTVLRSDGPGAGDQPSC
ncbi:hypothetical protein CCGE531_16045 [Rhizobium sp. CCGE531]|nr:hypothetical protein CCGE531_16045 [Rhizobium sp. CCGE531]AYG73756.1 hypothetical protein CCGE532_15550 [Rhizobium sp. CCGE532]